MGNIAKCNEGILKEESDEKVRRAKDKKIKAEVKKLAEIYAEYDESVKKLVAPLIDNAAFMKITLEELRAAINTVGCVSEYKNGADQWGVKKSPEVEVFMTMQKNYAVIIKQLADFLPKTAVQPVEEDDGFVKFVSGRDV